jgi:hypothetical protein
MTEKEARFQKFIEAQAVRAIEDENAFDRFQGIIKELQKTDAKLARDLGDDPDKFLDNYYMPLQKGKKKGRR